MAANNAISARTTTFVLAGGQGQRLFPLTRDMAKPMVPIGGRHRLIDFTLSNCVNSELQRIGVLTQHHSESIHSYVDGLMQQSLNERFRGEFLCCMSPAAGKTYRGTADAVFQNLSILESAGTDFVLILSADHVYKMDYRDLIRRHSSSGADVTVAAAVWPIGGASQFGVFEIDATERVIHFQEKPERPRTISNNPSASLVSMGVYIFNIQALIKTICEDARQDTSHDFGKDIIPALVRSGRVSVYNYSDSPTQLGSYWRDVGTLEAYYRVNFELLSNGFLEPCDVAEWPLYSLEAAAAKGLETSSKTVATPSINFRRGVNDMETSMTLLLSQIPVECCENELTQWIEARGYRVLNIKLIRDIVSGTSPSFASVELREPREIEQAAQSLDGQTIRGRVIRVRPLAPPERKISPLARRNSLAS